MLVIAFPHIDPVAFSIGPLAVRWYGLAYFAGILLGWLYMRRLVADARLWGGRPAPLTLADVDDFLLWGTLGIILGGRLGYAMFYQPDHYLDDPLGFFRLWEGGMSFHGGLLGIIHVAFPRPQNDLLILVRRGAGLETGIEVNRSR